MNDYRLQIKACYFKTKNKICIKEYDFVYTQEEKYL